jgi:hypothetical protein
LFSTAAEALDHQVRAGDDLQRVLDLAQPGDVIYLEAGATFRGNYVLNVKNGAGYITVRSSTPDSLLPAAGTRITPAYASLLPKLESPNNVPSLRTAAGAHHWRLIFLEFGPNRFGYGEILRLGEGWIEQSLLSQVPYEIEVDRVYMHGHPLYGQKRGIAMNGRSVTIKNSWISDIKAVGMDTQGIGGWNGPGPLVVENNYIEASGENILLGGADPAIQGLITEDVVIRGNYVTRPLSWRNPIIPAPKHVTWSATTGTLPSGTYAYRIVARRNVGNGSIGTSLGTDVVLAASGGVRLVWDAVPDAEDYVVYGRRANAFDRYWVVTTPAFTDSGTAGTVGAPPSGLGDVWQVKNLFELKNARRVVVENNLFENNWKAAQPGYAILFTVRNQDGTCTWCVVSDVRFEYNVVRNVAAGINILGYDYPNVSAQSHSITIRHNLFERVTTALGGNGWFLLMGLEPRNVIVDHNTVDHDGTTVVYAYSAGSTPVAMPGFRFTNNAVRHNEYGINGAGTSTGTLTLSGYFPDGVVTGNWMPGGSATRYPAGNYFSGTFLAGFAGAADGDWRPASNSLLIGAATDGTDIGAAIAALMTRVSSVVSGNPTVGGVPKLSSAAPRAPSGLVRVVR